MNIQANILSIFLHIQKEVAEKHGKINFWGSVVKTIALSLSSICFGVLLINIVNYGLNKEDLLLPLFIINILGLIYIVADIITHRKTSKILKKNSGISEYLQTLLSEKNFEEIMKATEKAQGFLEPPENEGGEYITLNSLIRELIVVEKIKVIPADQLGEDKAFYIGRYPYASRLLLWTKE